MREIRMKVHVYRMQKAFVHVVKNLLSLASFKEEAESDGDLLLEQVSICIVRISECMADLKNLEHFDALKGNSTFMILWDYIDSLVCLALEFRDADLGAFNMRLDEFLDLAGKAEDYWRDQQ